MASRECRVCKKRFSSNAYCTQHEKNVHKINVDITKNFLCSECRRAYQTRHRFDDHLAEYHPDINLKVENLIFYSQDDFEKWKLDISNKSASQYRIRQYQKTSSSTVCIYNCQRSGVFQSQSKGIRNLKIGGSCKTGFYCPSRIKTQTFGSTSEEMRIETTFYGTHMGHSSKISQHPLTKRQRRKLARQIESTTSPTKQIASSKSQDFGNISACYENNNSVIDIANDLSSGEPWINKIQSSDNLNENKEQIITEKNSIISTSDVTGEKNKENSVINNTFKPNLQNLIEQARASISEIAEMLDRCTEQQLKEIIQSHTILKHKLEEMEKKDRQLSPVVTVNASAKKLERQRHSVRRKENKIMARNIVHLRKLFYRPILPSIKKP